MRIHLNHLVPIAVATLLLSSLVSFFRDSLSGQECKDIASSAMDLWTTEETAAGLFKLLQIRHENATSTSPLMRCFIFIHGHAGSVGQAALIAKTLFELDSANYKVFVIHSNEGLSALDSHILLQQAHFVVHSIKHLQTAYKINRVTILAHSMGGIVARLVFTLPDYVPGSIETLVTFATPHLYPPVSIEQDMVQLYASVNQFWRFEFSSNVSANSSLVFGDLVVVSIAGGLRDLQIQSQFSDIGSIVPSTHGVSVFTSGIPGVWRDLGHEGILTCPPLMEAVAQSFLKERGSRQERIDAWNWNLLGRVPRLDTLDSKALSQTQVVVDIRKFPYILVPNDQSSMHVRMDLSPNSSFTALAANVSFNLWACESSHNCVQLDPYFSKASSYPAIQPQVLELSPSNLIGFSHVVLDILSSSSSSVFMMEAPTSPSNNDKINLQYNIFDAFMGREFVVPLGQIKTQFSLPHMTESFMQFTFIPSFSCQMG